METVETVDNRVRYFTIPDLPTSKNVWQKLHWAKRAKKKAEWEEWVWGSVNEQPRLHRPLPSVTCHVIVLWNKSGPLPDHHNLEMAFECIADGLVKAGIIKDDSGTQFMRGGLKLIRADKGETNVILRW